MPISMCISVLKSNHPVVNFNTGLNTSCASDNPLYITTLYITTRYKVQANL